MKKGKILLIGFGPGHHDHITHRAKEAILESDIIIGYNTYVDLIRELISDQSIVRTGMTEEVSRAIEAVRLAEEGQTVGVISSGDAGVYGMAGLVYEVLVEKGWTEQTGVSVEVVPGISAIQSCASLLGAPIMHDAATISLSDHLTPWETIAKRVEAAASADFVIALYNPRSGRRTKQIEETQKILLQYRSPDTPVGLVKSAYRDREQVIITRLADMLNHEIGMLTTVIIGNSTTFVYDSKIITPRGYQRKYTLNRLDQPLKPHERLQEKAEPWALHSHPDFRDENTSSQGLTENGAVAVLEESASDSLIETNSDSIKASSTIAQEKETDLPLYNLALEALACLDPNADKEQDSTGSLKKKKQSTNLIPRQGIIEIFEVQVSPGVAKKSFSSEQMLTLAQLTSNEGEMMYSPEHTIFLRLPQVQPEEVVESLKSVGFLVLPVDSCVQVKACDFCDMEKDESIPIAEELGRRLNGLAVPKELKIGLNGCGMACYGAVLEDIGLVYRRGAFDVFLGGKRIGRNAHPGQQVVEGVPAEQVIELVEQLVTTYKNKGHLDERFHKFFKRVGSVLQFRHAEYTGPLEIDSICGD
ncbi:precorrin-3B C(17)-methyltransferase [Brevibacillus daliensis]|uniref:precorrin-3B C(17)-methyltransferase n=1 Tax=Brevibacillus daliensis TaxID=2892995 RepID=UPI001E520F2D|nr:precorrin-3B C(17)-methyltransferase [Brevibacillus daliensis]